MSLINVVDFSVEKFIAVGFKNCNPNQDLFFFQKKIYGYCIHFAEKTVKYNQFDIY